MPMIPRTGLISVNNVENYSYNGLGDGLTQIGVQYVLDLNAGLTQVLDDGTNTYTYGLGRISHTDNTQAVNSVDGETITESVIRIIFRSGDRN